MTPTGFTSRRLFDLEGARIRDDPARPGTWQFYVGLSLSVPVLGSARAGATVRFSQPPASSPRKTANVKRREKGEKGTAN